MNLPAQGGPFDAAPFGAPGEGGAGRVWEDPREIHRVVAHFTERPPEGLELHYWRGLRNPWPQKRLSKDGVPGGGNVGWWELGNWYSGEWKRADTVLELDGSSAAFAFRPLDREEFPELSGFPATYRTTLKICLKAPSGLPSLAGLEAYTDSTWELATLTVIGDQEQGGEPVPGVFNGHLVDVEVARRGARVLRLLRARNVDPNTFDRTLITLHRNRPVTIMIDDLSAGPVWVPDAGVCLVAGREERSYGPVCAEVLARHPQGVYDRVRGSPEQTWGRAWREMTPKREPIYLPLGTDGGRHRFGLRPDGSVFYRTNDRYLAGCHGRDTSRLDADRERTEISFGLPSRPVDRTIQDGCLPIGIAAWEAEGGRVEQVAFATTLAGTDPDGPPPEGDAPGVWMGGFTFDNPTGRGIRTGLRLRLSSKGGAKLLGLDPDGGIRSGERILGFLDAGGKGEVRPEGEILRYAIDLRPGERHPIAIRIPYVSLDGAELRGLRALDFGGEREAVARYWTRRLDEGLRLLTPEPMLNEFHRAHAGHLLINCEREPGSRRRFARVGSFGYGAFGNESCMMIADLDRRGYHGEARACLDAFLEYQGSVPLPGDFGSTEGVLYGAKGYECGGYNQHHGWILWALVEHYRFTRDAAWLRGIGPNLIAAADWIVRERCRTAEREDIGRGLMPHGSLEDIGDWWQWLSTNAYSWRGLDAAAWALGEIRHAEVGRVLEEARAYRGEILRAFTEAAGRSPVVRLRDGTSVAHFPSHVHRRGRCLGWICETLEGAIHLLITRLVDPGSQEGLSILKDYEDNLYLSWQYGYPPEDFERDWFDLGGFSMQACLLLGVEPYLFRDDVKHALRAAFNAIAANYFADTRMLTEHALPGLGDWKGDHYKTSDEANAAGWLRYMFVREDGEDLLLGQAIPREWLRAGQRIGVEKAATHFGPMSLVFETDREGVTVRLVGPTRNPPSRIRLRVRTPQEEGLRRVSIDGRAREGVADDWIDLPGAIGEATIRVDF